MDLSFASGKANGAVTALPTGLAVLMAGVAARQAASVTANCQAGLIRRAMAARPLAPLHGTFNVAVAAALSGWQEE